MEKYYYLEKFVTLKSETLEKVIESWKEKMNIDEDLFDEFLEMMKLVDDALNKKAIKHLLSLDEEQFEVLHNAYEVIVEYNMNVMFDDTRDNFEDWLLQNDFHTPDTWAEFADDELKNYGIDAKCLSWVNDIYFYSELLQLDVYNDFTKYDYVEAFVEFLEKNLDYLF